MKRIFGPVIVSVFLLWGGFLSAKMLPPAPPEENPHPPMTAEDKKRVAFAEKALSSILGQALPSSLHEVKFSETPKGFDDKDLACLKKLDCYGKDPLFVNEILSLQKRYGKIVEVKHAHVIPWSFEKFKSGGASEPMAGGVPSRETTGAAKPMPAPVVKADEYMVHVYVKFDQAVGWHNLDVILTEDAAGNVSLRHFFVIPMYAPMPPNVVC